MEEILQRLDLIIIGVIIALAVTYVLTIGKGRAVTLLVATYITALTVRFIPDLTGLATKVDWFAQDFQAVALIALVLALVQTVLLRNGFFEPYIETEGIESVTFAISAVGLFLFTASYYLMPSTLEVIHPHIQTAFYEDPYRLAWPILPLVALLLLRGK